MWARQFVFIIRYIIDPGKENLEQQTSLNPDNFRPFSVLHQKMIHTNHAIRRWKRKIGLFPQAAISPLFHFFLYAHLVTRFLWKFLGVKIKTVTKTWIRSFFSCSSVFFCYSKYLKNVWTNQSIHWTSIWQTHIASNFSTSSNFTKVWLNSGLITIFKERRLKFMFPSKD